jgi:SAM-dependent methyltransferase
MSTAPRPLRILRTLRHHPIRCQRIYRQIAAELGPKTRDGIRARARSVQEHGYERYLDTPYYLRLNIARALALGLDDGKPRRVLDIGCGAGFFLLVCRHLGHSVQGLDLDSIAVFNESIEHFGIDRVTHEILPFEPLPAFEGRPFDLITAFAAKFERYDTPPGVEIEIWGEPEWAYFLNEIRERLVPGGLFHLKLNVTADHFNRRPELRGAFESAKGFEARFHDAKRISLRRVA